MGAVEIRFGAPESIAERSGSRRPGPAGGLPLGLGWAPIFPTPREPAGSSFRFRQPAAELLGLGMAHEIDRVIRALADVVAHRAVADGARLAWILGPLRPQGDPHDPPPLRLGHLE